MRCLVSLMPAFDATLYNGDTTSEVSDTAGNVFARICVNDVGTKFK